MAHDDRRDGGRTGRDRDWGPPSGWSGDEQAFGGGWGNQTPQRLGGRNYRGLGDDPDAGLPRYGAGPSEGYGAGGDFGPASTNPDPMSGAPGYDAEFAGPRFDRAAVGSTGSHGVHPVSSGFGEAYHGGFGAAGPGMRSSARRHAMIEREGQGGRGGGDPHYVEWRRRQMAQLDRDYEDYCSERQSRFE